jgi:hypothetical protein
MERETKSTIPRIDFPESLLARQKQGSHAIFAGGAASIPPTHHRGIFLVPSSFSFLAKPCT